MKAPIFIIGSGRSGTTILFEMLTRHPRMAWHTLLPDLFVDRDNLNRTMFLMNRLVMRAMSAPMLGDIGRRYCRPKEVWQYISTFIAPGFDEPCRDLTAGDVTPVTARAFRRMVLETLAGNRDQFIMKITGWPRIGFLQAIFPEAKFIHILRDGRSVVNSMMQLNWWKGWQGPEQWRYGPLSSEHQKIWDKFDRSFIALGGIMWLILMEAYDLAQERAAPGSVRIVRYEEFCEGPIETVRRILEFCGHDFPDDYRRELEKIPVRSANSRWRKDFTEEQQNILNQVLGPALERYGYPIGG